MGKFWQNITPWKEEKGETFGSALQNFWSKKPSPAPTYPSQPGVTTTYPSQPGTSQLFPNIVSATPPGGQPQTNPLTGWNPQPAPVAGRPANLYADWLNPPSTSLVGANVGGLPTPYSPKTISQGGHDYWVDDIGYWHEIGLTPKDQGANTAMTDYQKAMIDYQLQELAATQGLNEDELALRRQQMYQDAAYQNAQLAFQQQQWQQQQAQEQKNYLANLAAEPHSWLEYASAAGQAPVIQPWMLPLMPQDYGIYSAGQTMPGWNPQNMTGMPQLINPSAQYMARVGPTSQQQYYGYEQARTGQTPEETQWRLWSMSPPSGNRGLTQVR